MPQIGVERFRSGHGQEHGAQRDQTDDPVAGQKRQPIDRIESAQHAGVRSEMHETPDGDHREPHRHDRPEKRRDPGGAARLHQKQSDQDGHREGHYIRIEPGRDDLQTFDCGENRNGRGDDGIAVEQGRAADAEQEYHHAGRAHRALRQGHQRQRAAFPVVVEPQQDEHVFRGDDEQQRPNDQRQYAEHGRLGRHPAWPPGGDHRLAQCVERARADVAVNDAETAERQRPKAGLGVNFAVPMGRCLAPFGSGYGVGHLFCQELCQRCCTAQCAGSRLIAPDPGSVSRAVISKTQISHAGAQVPSGAPFLLLQGRMVWNRSAWFLVRAQCGLGEPALGEIRAGATGPAPPCRREIS